MVKVYELTRFDGMQIVVTWQGVNVHVEFKGGDSRHRAKFTTNNLFVQDAIENDPRFGKLFLLKEKYNDTPKAKAKAKEKENAKKQVTRVKSVNDAMRWFAENGFNPTGESDLSDLMEKAGVEFPNLKR